MAMEFTQQSYSTSKGILAFPDHYVAVAVKHAKAVSGNTGIATLVDGRYIVKAGTFYPANDATAIGVVLQDYDVTNGDANMAVVVHGFVNLAKLPAVPSANAKTALNMIKFMPISPYVAVTIEADALTVVEGEAADTEKSITVSINNATFRPEAAVETNWTVTGEATAKFALTGGVVAEDGKSIILNFKASATTAAGTITVQPAASIVSINSQPDAVTAITVTGA